MVVREKGECEVLLLKKWNCSAADSVAPPVRMADGEEHHKDMSSLA